MSKWPERKKEVPFMVTQTINGKDYQIEINLDRIHNSVLTDCLAAHKEIVGPLIETLEAGLEMPPGLLGLLAYKEFVKGTLAQYRESMEEKS